MVNTYFRLMPYHFYLYLDMVVFDYWKNKEIYNSSFDYYFPFLLFEYLLFQNLYLIFHNKSLIKAWLSHIFPLNLEKICW